MPECHKCQHNGKRHRVCLKCKGPVATNNKGRSHISMSAAQPPPTFRPAKGGQIQGFAETEAILHSLSASRPPSRHKQDRLLLADFVLRLIQLDRKTMKIVKARLLAPDLSLAIIARQMGITVQAAHQRLKAAAGEWPAISKMVGLNLKRK